MSVISCRKSIEFIRCLSRMSSHSCKVAVCQFRATNIKEDNLKTVRKLVSEAAQKNAQIAFLPEACDYVASNKTEIRSLAEPLDGFLMSQYKALAKEHNIWLSIGGFHEIRKIDADEILQNAHVLINENGEVAAVYRKMHLFDVTLPEKNVDLRESSYVAKGCEIVPPVNSPAGPVGLMICYDMRFPELSIILRNMGANILTFPSAFTSTTGQAHWEVLLRARAIENQCYVVAAAQYGCHNNTRVSHGQAMIVDPWGKIIAECPKYTEGIHESDCIAVVDIDPNLITQIRREMPVFEHRRHDMYNLHTVNNIPNKLTQYMFSHKVIPASTVFYTTQHSFAFTNIRCVVPGHVLVASIRQAKRLQDLSAEEVADLFQTVVKVQKVLEKVHSASSSTVCVQDGKEAGQTISHVHCHILPRRQGDFTHNDDVYQQLAKHDKSDNPQPIRSLQDMSAEAELLKSYF